MNQGVRGALHGWESFKGLIVKPKLPPEFLEPWRIGEETGSLDEVAKRLAEANAEAAEFWFGEFARWLPRVVYFLVCLLMIYYILKLAGIAMTGVSGLR